MRLGVGHRLHFGQPVGHHVPHLPDVPLLVGHLLELLDPEIGNRHPQPVVEADASVRVGNAHPRHARHVLGDRHVARAEVVHQPVGQRQVTDGIVILMTVEVVTIVTEGLTQSVTVIKHRSHPIETEAVEMELFQPVFTVRQQEVNHLVLAIVKAERIPCRMLTTSALIEILARITGKVAQSFHLVLHGV